MSPRAIETAPLAVVLSMVLAATGCGERAGRKIELAAGSDGASTGVATGSSVVRVALEEQRSLGIVTFENETGDASVEWLRRGLTDMLSTELSQSPYLKVLGPSRLDALLQRVDRRADDLRDDPVAARVASEAQVESFLAGRFRTDGDELVIDAELRDIASGQVLRRVSVRGPRNLERVFLMVADLSKQIREDLRGDLAQARDRGIRVGEMTSSTEAYRHYSAGLESTNKLLVADADHAFTQAVAADPSFGAAWLRLFMTRARLGDREGSAEALKMARQHVDRLPRTLEITLRQHEAAAVGDLSAMRAALDDLLDVAPDDIDARMEATSVLFHIGDYDRALTEYEAIIEIEPDRKLAYNQLAYVQAYRGDFASARRYLERYRELVPDEPNGYDSTGEILMMEGRLREAAEYFELALLRWPDFPSSLGALVSLHAELGDHERAMAYADRAIETAARPPLRAHAQVRKGLQEWRFGRREAAIATVESAQFTAPDRSDAANVLVLLLREAGRDAEASTVESKTLEALRLRAVTSGLDTDDGARFLRKALATDSFVSQLPALASQIDQAIATTDNDRLYIFRLVMLLRLAGVDPAAVGRASRAFDQRTEHVLSSLVSVDEPSRSGLWKHLGNCIENAAKAGGDGIELAKRLIVATSTTDRASAVLQSQLLQLRLDQSVGDAAAVVDGSRRLGIPLGSDWRVVGTFDPNSGFEQRFRPEIDGVDLAETYQADGRELGWRAADDGCVDGFVDLAAIFGRSLWGVAYAAIDVESATNRAVQLRLGSDESCKLWLNGELVWQAYRDKPVEVDADMVKVHLRAGRNTLLLKVTNTIDDWGFHLRVTGDDGRGPEGIQFRPIASRQQALNYGTESPVRLTN